MRRFDAWRNTKEVCDALLGRYILVLLDKGKSASTIKNSVNAVKFREVEGLDRPSPKGRIVKQAMKRAMREATARRGQAQGLEEEQVRSIMVAAGGTAWGVRNRALIALAYYRGLRISEVVAVNIEDLTFFPSGFGKLKITRSKTDQQGRGVVMDLCDLSVDPLREWIAISGISKGPLFRIVEYGLDHEPVIGEKRLSRCQAAKTIKRLGRKAGFSISSHSLRRSFAMRLTRLGFPIQVVAIEGRWSTTDQVLTYIQGMECTDSAVLKVRKRQQSIRLVS